MACDEGASVGGEGGGVDGVGGEGFGEAEEVGCPWTCIGIWAGGGGLCGGEDFRVYD